MTFLQASALVTRSGLKTVSVASTQSSPTPIAAGPAGSPATPSAAQPNFPSRASGATISPAISTPRPLAGATVIGQTPAAGCRVTSGASVALEVSHS